MNDAVGTGLGGKASSLLFEKLVGESDVVSIMGFAGFALGARGCFFRRCVILCMFMVW